LTNKRLLFISRPALRKAERGSLLLNALSLKKTLSPYEVKTTRLSAARFVWLFYKELKFVERLFGPNRLGFLGNSPPKNATGFFGVFRKGPD